MNNAHILIAANAKRSAARSAALDELVRRVVAAGPAGATCYDIDIGQSKRTREAAMQELQAKKRVFGLRKYINGKSGYLYFGTEAQRDEARTDPKRVRSDEAKAQKNERRRKRYRELTGGAVRAKSAPKPTPKKRELPKPQQHQKMTIHKPAQASASEAFRAAQADYSRAVVTRIPTPRPRFEPEPGFHRAITQDWRERRLQGIA